MQSALMLEFLSSLIGGGERGRGGGEEGGGRGEGRKGEREGERGEVEGEREGGRKGNYLHACTGLRLDCMENSVALRKYRLHLRELK